MAFFPVMEHENVSSHKAHIGTLGKIFTCTCVLVHTSHMRVRCMHAYDCRCMHPSVPPPTLSSQLRWICPEIKHTWATLPTAK